MKNNINLKIKNLIFNLKLVFIHKLFKYLNF